MDSKKKNVDQIDFLYFKLLVKSLGAVKREGDFK